MRTSTHTPRREDADRLLLLWMAFSGLLLFGYYMLWVNGVWKTLLEADPTGITALTVVVFTCSTAWVGFRMVHLRGEHKALLHARTNGGAYAGSTRGASAISRYLQDSSPQLNADAGLLTQVLADRLHGPNEFMWWVNGIQIKLGLLGKVVGFSILAIQISQVENFDPSQTANLLKTLTGGLSIALLTTAVGLVTNMLLGLQLARIDRLVDGLLADTVEFTQTRNTR